MKVAWVYGAELEPEQVEECNRRISAVLSGTGVNGLLMVAADDDGHDATHVWIAAGLPVGDDEHQHHEHVVVEDLEMLKQRVTDDVAAGVNRWAEPAHEWCTEITDERMWGEEFWGRLARTVVLDFDGVLHSYVSGWTGPVPTDPPNPGAVQFCRDLIGEGYELVVMSSRANSAEGHAATVKWLQDNDFPPMNVTNVKVPGVAYVDDRGVRFQRREATGRGNWMFCLHQVRELAAMRTPVAKPE